MSSRSVICVLAAAALLQPILAAVDVDINLDASNPNFDLDAIEKAYPELHEGLLKYGRHLRHSRSSKPVLLKHTHNLHHAAAVTFEDGAALDSDADDKALEAAMADDKALDAAVPKVDAPLTLPGRHPSVEKALDGMSGDLEILKEKKNAANEARGELEGVASDAFHHMNDAMSIKHAMAEKESQLRIESSKLQVLEKDAGKLEETKANLVSSLHRMLEPKVLLTRQRFEKREMILHREANAARAWKEKKDQLKVAAMELIKQKKSSYQALLDAEAEAAQAKKKEELARINFEHHRTQTAETVQSYHYAETRYKAQIQHEQNAKKMAMEARESVEKLHNVAQVEQEKVDQSIAFRKEHLAHKMQQVEAEREKSSHDLTDLEQKYRDWQQLQRERTAEVVRKSQETASASDAYAGQQQQVLDSASAKVVRDAEAVGDWDGWGADTKVEDEDDI